MGKKQHSSISTFGGQITATISVALVLLILGIISMLGLAAKSVTDNIKQNMGFVVELNDDTSDDIVNNFKQSWASSPYVSSVVYISAEEALQQEAELMGEDIMSIMDVNPYHAEFEVKMMPQYANGDSIEKIVEQLSTNPNIAKVRTDPVMIESVNHSINNIILVLTIIAAALLLISFVLINNTVRLTVYSRRFLIHTMKLVGATGGFIRKPFIINNIINGIIAAILAILTLTGLLYYIKTLNPSVNEAISWNYAAYIFVGIIFTGIIICSVATLFATNKYLHIDYDDMFK